MLTDLECKKAVCPEDKRHIRLHDGGSLYLQVAPNGSKRWFYKYVFSGKEKHMALGNYPAVSLTAARRARDEARLLKASGVEPIARRKGEKLRLMNPAGDTFEEVAREWLDKQLAMWSSVHAERVTRQLDRDLIPFIGDRKIDGIAPAELLAVLRKVEQRGAIETADRCLQVARQIWRYAIATSRATVDATASLKQALTPYRTKHFAAITEPEALGKLLRAIAAYRGGLIVKTALQLAPILFQRPGELRAAAWSEMDLENGLWTIPAARMKRSKDGKEKRLAVCTCTAAYVAEHVASNGKSSWKQFLAAEI